MPCQLPEEISYVSDDVFSYMCNLAMEKCSRKTEKKKASCGGAAMRKRLLIKNFVAQMLAQEKQSREAQLFGKEDSTAEKHNTIDELNSSITTNSSSTRSSSIELQLDEECDDEEEGETDQEDEADSEHDTSALLEDEELEDEEEEEETEQDSDEAEAEAAAAAILAAKRGGRLSVDGNNNGGRQSGNGWDNQQRGGRPQTQMIRKRLVGSSSDDEEEGISVASPPPLHNLLPVKQQHFGCWRSPRRTKLLEEDGDDDEDFHRVPMPEHHAGMEQMFTDNIATKISPPNPLANNFPPSFRLYGSIDHHTAGYGLHPSDFLASTENLFQMGGQQQQMAEDDEGKLYLLERAENGMADGEQLVGLVANMVPSSLKFNQDPLQSHFFHHSQPLQSQDNLSAHTLTELDTVDFATNDNHQLMGSRKRPWSAVFDEMDMESSAEQFNGNCGSGSSSSPMLSPLCCGLLQLQPFGSAPTAGPAAMALGTATGGAQPPLMKRVKL